MEQTRTIRQQNYEKASLLLGKLFDASSDITEQIDCYIRHNGIGAFFENLEASDFSGEVLEKLRAVKTVLFGLSEEAMLGGGGMLEEKTE